MSTMRHQARRPAAPQRLPDHVYRRRRVGCAGVTLVVLAALLGGFSALVRACSAPDPAPTPTVVPEPTTPPLSSEGFDPGMILSDARFTDATTMSEKDIAAFIDTWGTGCREGEQPCLKDYRTTSTTRPATPSCPKARQGGDNLSAATIIWRTAQACGINPQVILATLQKEQGLITASSHRLTAERYEWAMGYGCPDGGTCDRQFAGFDTQIYQAAAQWKRYMNEPRSYAIRPGVVNQIAHAPDPSCGHENVRVANKATAALYNYTPYVPTADALAGNFEGCNGPGAGNLRFYQYFTAWFGR